MGGSVRRLLLWRGLHITLRRRHGIAAIWCCLLLRLLLRVIGVVGVSGLCLLHLVIL